MRLDYVSHALSFDFQMFVDIFDPNIAVSSTKGRPPKASTLVPDVSMPVGSSNIASRTRGWPCKALPHTKSIAFDIICMQQSTYYFSRISVN